jgi:hypothetical protein
LAKKGLRECLVGKKYWGFVDDLLVEVKAPLRQAILNLLLLWFLNMILMRYNHLLYS